MANADNGTEGNLTATPNLDEEVSENGNQETKVEDEQVSENGNQETKEQDVIKRHKGEEESSFNKKHPVSKKELQNRREEHPVSTQQQKKEANPSNLEGVIQENVSVDDEVNIKRSKIIVETLCNEAGYANDGLMIGSTKDQVTMIQQQKEEQNPRNLEGVTKENVNVADKINIKQSQKMVEPSCTESGYADDEQTIQGMEQNICQNLGSNKNQFTTIQSQTMEQKHNPAHTVVNVFEDAIQESTTDASEDTNQAQSPRGQVATLRPAQGTNPEPTRTLEQQVMREKADEVKECLNNLTKISGFFASIVILGITIGTPALDYAQKLSNCEANDRYKHTVMLFEMIALGLLVFSGIFGEAIKLVIKPVFYSTRCITTIRGYHIFILRLTYVICAIATATAITFTLMAYMCIAKMLLGNCEEGKQSESFIYAWGVLVGIAILAYASVVGLRFYCWDNTAGPDGTGYELLHNNGEDRI